MSKRILHLSDVRVHGDTLIAVPVWAFGGGADCRRVVAVLNARRRRAHAQQVKARDDFRARFDAGDTFARSRVSFLARYGGSDPFKAPAPPDLYTSGFFQRQLELWSPYVRRCRQCQVAFLNVQHRARTLYCSDACYYAARLGRPRPSRATVRVPRSCPECGKKFTPTRRDAKFCGVRCRVAAHRHGGTP